MVEQTDSRHADRDIVEFVQELVVARANTSMYWADHPSVEAPVDALVKILPQILTRLDKDSLALGTFKNHLIVDERAIIGASVSAPRLIKAILDRSSGGIAFDQQSSRQDFKNFLTIISRKLNDSDDTDTLNQELFATGCQKIRFLPPYDVSRRVANLGGLAGQAEIDEATQLYQAMVDALQGNSAAISDGGQIGFGQIQTVVERVVKVMATDPGRMFHLAGYESYDAYTFGHSVRVALLALDLTASLTTDQGILNRVGVAALLHDIGKVRLPFDLLYHKGDWTEEQRREMEKHPQYGAEILIDHEGCDPMAYAVAFGHHRSVTLGGYPRMLQRVDLSKVTCIVEICDVYEALTAVRPHRPAMTPAHAFRTMLSMEGKFDQGLLAQFIRVHGVYPNGTELRMSTGECARVMRQTGDPRRPLVKIETDRSGSVLDLEHQTELDLSLPSDQAIQIAQLVPSGVV